MKTFLVSLGLLFGLLTAPGFAEEGKAAKPEVDVLSSSYTGKKDKAYWTRVWYAKQAKKGKHYKRKSYAGKKKKSRKAYTGGGGRVLAKIDLSQQRMQVFQGGKLKYSWPVSSGRKGYRTPTGTWTIHRMHKRYFSKKYHGAPMPYAMFYYRGFAIHGTNAISRLGRPASHGCVRLHPSNAATLFAMVRRSGGTVRVTQ
ncbi:MAG: L,D-transpeptidase [Pseudomonadota bacterium]